MLLLDRNFPFFLMVHLSHIMVCTGKWIQHFAETLLPFNLHFQHLGLNLQENKVYHSKERKLLA